MPNLELPETFSQKILPAAAVVEWRATMGPDLAVVVGTFDLLQPGNLALLLNARRRAQNTFVLLQPDSPGSSRNLTHHSVAERAEFLAHLRLIDGLSVWPTPHTGDLLQALRPFSWITATSQVETEPGRDLLLRTAKQVIPEPDLPGCFTGEIYQALKSGATPIPLPPFFANLPPPPSPTPSIPPTRRVTVNGCFDILHIGHLHLLRQAAAMGDELCVLINSDASVRHYKGPTRPVFHQACRRAALQAISGIRDVHIFDTDKPLELIAALQPALHVKGGSFEPDRVREEEELVARWGGKIAFCPLSEGYSSTAVIHRIQSR
jgi:rfaE bifunctional protein nucleotidyltransferase chain/domain